MHNKTLLSVSFAFLVAPLVQAQLSVDQKLLDFQDLAAAFTKHYALSEWKRDAVAFDGLNLTSWLDRVRTSKDDLDFWTICAEYVASNQDSHSSFLIPSDYYAALGISAD